MRMLFGLGMLGLFGAALAAGTDGCGSGQSLPKWERRDPVRDATPDLTYRGWERYENLRLGFRRGD